MVITDINKFDQQRFYLLTHKIKQNKHEYDSIIESSPHEYLKSTRYEDDGRIARMVVGEIYRESNFDIKEAASKFLSLNSTEIESYIKFCILDAARADYYYTYEKQWD